MFVTRPKSILGTPKSVAKELGARLRVYPSPKKPNRIFDFRRDFLYTLPTINNVRNAPEGYAEAWSFFHHNKYAQRVMLAQGGLSIPDTAGSYAGARELGAGKFVVRRLYHQKGQFYRTTDDPGAFQEGAEYISKVFPKTREYRIIYLFGEPVIQLRKIPPEGAKPEDAWNHAQGAVFKTVKDVDGGVLKSKTDCYQKLAAFAPIKASHICAVDVIFNSKKKPNYVVVEINACPSLRIDANFSKVIEAIKGRR